MSLHKCLIANRGEIAVRVIHACRELGIVTVAIYSESDTNARHVQLADEAYLVGAAPAAESYLVGETLISIAQESGCDCVHPGYGFLSENAGFAEAVLDAGLVWIGPPPQAIHAMGVKTEARAIMAQAGVPLVPGFASDDASDEAFEAAAENIGFPIMVKAAGGGGGKGIRIVREKPDLLDAIAAARREASKAFGDSRVFLERFIENGRHIEVQVIADTHGTTLHLYERECSTQRRHQKIIEESPSPLLTNAQRMAIGQAGVNAAQAVGYINAGTVEFIATPDGDFFFLEMNTRLQVEHPVTEMVTGLDLVKLQFTVAAGNPLPITQDDVHPQGHAIECRIYAEDPHNNFLPATGQVLRFIPPSQPGVRVDAGIQSGDHVTVHYDPMIAKIIAYGETREQTIDRMRQALRETVVLGLTTNIEFLLALLDYPAFEKATLHTRTIDEELASILPPLADLPEVVLLAAALNDLSTRAEVSVVHGDADADRYSPWSRSDSFRLGVR